MPFKTPVLAFMASLAAHALLLVSFSPVWENKEPDNRSVEISYVRYDIKQPDVSKSIQAASSYKQIKYPPVAKEPHQVIKVKAEITPMSRPANNEKRESAPVDSIPTNSVAIRSGSEFLSDPLKGKIFLNYFGLIKQRVRRAVEKKYSGDHVGRGDASLLFVLKSDGTVVNVFVVDKDSSADEVMKDFAVRCVKECSPFPHFPKELGMERISFSLSILFDESH